MFEPSSRRAGMEPRWCRSKAVSVANLLMLGEGCDVATLTCRLHLTSQSKRPSETLKRADLRKQQRQGNFSMPTDGAIVDHDPEKVQRLTDDCTERFSRVGLKMNDKKTKAFALEGAKAPTMISKEGFDRQQGVGDCRTCREKALSKVQCQLCGAMSQKPGLPQHQLRAARLRGREEWKRKQNEVTEEPASKEEEEPVLPPVLPQEHCVSALPGAKTECPVLHHCSGTHGDPSKLTVHFQQRHLKDTIVIEPEGRLPRRANCGMFSPAVGAKHQATMTRRKATERRQKQTMAAKEHERLEKDAVFTVSGKPIEMVDTFKHLGRVTAETDRDEAAALRNLEQARRKRASMQMVLVLTRDGVWPKTMAVFCRAAVSHAPLC